ncbi:hypothetical protein Fmac_018395 [Flemingia macrophylla]|uniref:hydroxyethylthiazole kinase n=1 Tax=Flemingia macrophylla TaxID=520843 RepID=A0ABD1M4V5_9FABA
MIRVKAWGGALKHAAIRRRIPRHAPRRGGALDVLYVNVSMVCPSWLLAINTTAKHYFDLDIPWVLDPVDASASASAKLHSDLGKPWVLDPIDAFASAKLCFDLGTPWVLDPIDASAFAFHFHARRQLLLLNPNLVRGNASEISPSKGEPSASWNYPRSTLELSLGFPSDAKEAG